MRLSSIIFSILLVSCSGNSEDKETQVSENEIAPESTEEVNSEEIVADESTTAKDFFIEDMPTNWQHLEYSETEEGKLIMYHYCEAEVPSISFQAEKGEDWTIYTGYGQDGEIRTVSNFSGVSEEIAGFETVKGSFDVINDSSGEKVNVSFIWTKEDMICEFKGLNYSPGYFIPVESIEMVDHIHEDCDGLWEDM